MSVEQKDKIDFISTDKSGEIIVLTISDHLDWKNPYKHLMLLQEKLNSYLAFYESGQIFDIYPEAKGKKVLIEIAGKEALHEDGVNFLKKVNEIIRDIDLELRFRMVQS